MSKEVEKATDIFNRNIDSDWLDSIIHDCHFKKAADLRDFLEDEVRQCARDFENEARKNTETSNPLFDELLMFAVNTIDFFGWAEMYFEDYQRCHPEDFTEDEEDFAEDDE